jgi:ribulose-phosphate 3-epimerase
VDLIPLVDMILVMTVHPGFGGQKFIGAALGKIPAMREAAARAGRDLDVEVDGGIGPATIADVARAGANVFVAGNSIFSQPDPGQAVRDLRNLLAGGSSAGPERYGRAPT